MLTHRLVFMLLESVSTVVHCGFLIATAIFPLTSIRVFCIAAVICIFLVLPVNYYGKEMIHTNISSESLEVFTIANVQEGSGWYALNFPLLIYFIETLVIQFLY